MANKSPYSVERCLEMTEEAFDEYTKLDSLASFKEHNPASLTNKPIYFFRDEEDMVKNTNEEKMIFLGKVIGLSFIPTETIKSVEDIVESVTLVIQATFGEISLSPDGKDNWLLKRFPDEQIKGKISLPSHY